MGGVGVGWVRPERDAAVTARASPCAPPALAAATAAVLVGGRGTRLAPVVADRPKPLADVGTRPFLAYLLDRLAAAGLARVILCTGHRGPELRALVGTRYGSLRLDYSEEPVPAGTAGALRLAATRSDADPLLVLNGDSLCDVDLAAVWSLHHVRRAAATVVVAGVPDARRFGRVVFDDDGRVAAFREKSPESGPGWVNAGIYVLPRARLAALDAGRPISLEHEVLPAWIGAGLYAYVARGALVDIGTPADYAAAQARLGEIGGMG